MKQVVGLGETKQVAARAGETEQTDKVQIITAALPPDRSHVKLTMLPGSGAAGDIILTPRGLQGLIETLGRVMAKMREGQPTPALDSTDITSVFDPRWQVSRGLMGEASAFAFHHPCYGPLGFLVPIEQVEGIIGALSEHVRAATAEKAKKN